MQRTGVIDEWNRSSNDLSLPVMNVDTLAIPNILQIGDITFVNWFLINRTESEARNSSALVDAAWFVVCSVAGDSCKTFAESLNKSAPVLATEGAVEKEIAGRV